MGIAALIWTVDCFVGVYLTLPPKRKKSPTFNIEQRSFWPRWKPSWLVKWRSSSFRVNFDLHRAGGLWVWIMLFILAWSSVMFNLPQVYHPVMKAIFNMPNEPITVFPKLAIPQPEPALSWREAHRAGQRLMAEQSNIHGFEVRGEAHLEYSPEKGIFTYAVTSDRDINDALGTMVLFDSTTGKFLMLSLQTGQNIGTTFDRWLLVLHMAKVGGLPYKLFVCFIGLVITMLSITGVYIWLKKRRAARFKRKVLI